jgi:hypothetical protein
MTEYMTQAPTETKPQRAPRGIARLHRVAPIIGAAIAASIAWTFLTQVSGVALTIRDGRTTQHVGLAAVILAALATGLAGWALLALLERHARRPYRAWRVIALIVFVLSLLGPLGASTGSAMAALAALHLTVATILMIGLPRGCANR